MDKERRNMTMLANEKKPVDYIKYMISNRLLPCQSKTASSFQTMFALLKPEDVSSIKTKLNRGLRHNTQNLPLVQLFGQW